MQVVSNPKNLKISREHTPSPETKQSNPPSKRDASLRSPLEGNLGKKQKENKENIEIKEINKMNQDNKEETPKSQESDTRSSKSIITKSHSEQNIPKHTNQEV